MAKINKVDIEALLNMRLIIPSYQRPYKWDVLSQVFASFNVGDYVVEYDDHYHCKNCVGDLFN